MIDEYQDEYGPMVYSDQTQPIVYPTASVRPADDALRAENERLRELLETARMYVSPLAVDVHKMIDAAIELDPPR